tara:strand:+ start:9080 stop:10396 length:1317 start_codon:yes stop_codon:yes gene_type:complete
MKFLMTMYQIQDYGGIINHAENLALGLKELGHEVDFNILVPKHKVTNRSKPPKDFNEYQKLGTGYYFHQAKGWYAVPKIPYLDKYARQNFIEKGSQYDAILWHIPVPTLSKDNQNINAWTELYDNGSHNVAIIHDGNLPKLYPHLSLVQDKFHSCVCVHESAYNSAENIGIPRKLIVNPFDMKKLAEFPAKKFEDKSGFSAIQVFKAWKRMDTLIRAIPFLKNTEKKVVGGKGIEYRYMTSEKKCKPKYYNAKSEKIWDEALHCGMNYVGTVKNDIAFEHFSNSKVQIDPSWSLKYSSYGAHFNRTTVEAIMVGTVPMATDLGMINSKIFIAGKNYVKIPATLLPKQFGELIDETLSNKNQWLTIVGNNYLLLDKFSLHSVALEYCNLITETTENLKIGKVTEEMARNANKNLCFFNIDSQITPARLPQTLFDGGKYA